MNRQQLTSIVACRISSRRGSILSDYEKDLLYKWSARVKLSSLKTSEIDNVIDILVDDATQELLRNRRSDIDLHELQIATLGKDAESAVIDKKVELGETVDSLLQTPATLQSIFNPNALQRTGYLILDRKYQARDSLNTHEFKWNISNISKNHESVGTAVTTAQLKNIVEIRVYPFIFPNTLLAITRLKRLSLEFIELNTQSYITANNTRFHLMFDIEKTVIGNTFDVYQTSDISNNKTSYKFHDPIIEISMLTLRFGNPIKTLTLDADYLYGTITASGVFTLITFTTAHRCVVGDTVVVSGFTTTTPNDLVDSALITLMNYPDGWQILSLTTNTITIPVDIAALNGAITGGPFYVYLESKRFMLQLEYTYLTERGVP